MKALLVILAAVAAFFVTVVVTGISPLGTLVLGMSLLYLLQGSLTVVAMLHSWVEPKRMYGVRPPKEPSTNERVTFSLIIPCRHEEAVIGDTLRAMAKIDYPRNLYEVLVSIRDDDLATIEVVKTTINELWEESVVKGITPPQIKLVTFHGGPLRKARNLNVALEESQYGFVGVFDAEDEPHPAILRKVEAVIQRKKVDAVQGGVQLINVASRWFTALNCLEYYFWFKSVLPFLAKLGATPVGGNTIFFRTKILHRLKGWDEEALTEDADIGIRLSAEGYKIATIYDETLATLEEAPTTVGRFIRQRSRWDQGYAQVLAKGEWVRLKSFRQQFLTFYLLFWMAFLQLLYAIGTVMLPVFALAVQVEVPIAAFSFLPLYFLVLQLAINTIGLKMIKEQYKLKFSRWLYPWVWISYFPYQILLGVAALRSMVRGMSGSLVWDKTTHLNIHRAVLGAMPEAQVVSPVVSG